MAHCDCLPFLLVRFLWPRRRGCRLIFSKHGDMNWLKWASLPVCRSFLAAASHCGWFSDHVLKGRCKMVSSWASLMAAPAFMGVLIPGQKRGLWHPGHCRLHYGPGIRTLFLHGYGISQAEICRHGYGYHEYRRQRRRYHSIIIGYLVAYAGYDAVFMFMIATQVLTALIIFFRVRT